MSKSCQERKKKDPPGRGQLHKKRPVIMGVAGLAVPPKGVSNVSVRGLCF